MLEMASVQTALIDRGKPGQNGNDESFSGRLRDECLSTEWFRTRREAKVIIEAWREDYNAIRPHSRLDYLTRSSFDAVTNPSTRESFPNPTIPGQVIDRMSWLTTPKNF
jgi:transposase InsO family protein